MSNSNSEKLTVEDIRYGSYFDYDLIQWKAVGENNYRWNDGTFSREFKISGNGETRYLEVEDQEKELRVLVTRKIRVGAIDGNVASFIKSNDKAPESIVYHNRKYFLKEQAEGEFLDVHGHDDWEPFEVWDYFDSTDKNFISIERWEGNEFEAFIGKIVRPKEFTNITAGKSFGKETAGWLGKNLAWVIFIGFFLAQFTLCNNNSDENYHYQNPTSYSVSQEGLTETLNEQSSRSDFTLLLNDMTYRNKKYYHRYEILYTDLDSVKSEITNWKLVSPSFFRIHKDHLGLELASKKGGVLTENVAPPGFSQYVGNEKFGQWQEDNNGNRTWSFFAKYAVLNLVMNRIFGAPRYASYSKFRSSPRGSFNFTNRYNTRNYLTSQRGKASQWGIMPQNIRQEAEEEYSSSGGSSRTSRSGNRYSNRSSRRSSRGGK